CQMGSASRPANGHSAQASDARPGQGYRIPGRHCRTGGADLGHRQLFAFRQRHHQVAQSMGGTPVLTLTLGIGIAVSLILFQLVGLSAGGVIAPGYVALVLDRPGILVTIALCALVTWGMVALLSRVLFLYGTRRFGVTILIALILTTGVQAHRGGLGPIA